MPSWPLAGFALLALLLGSACDDDGGDGSEATPTPTAGPTQAATPTPGDTQLSPTPEPPTGSGGATGLTGQTECSTTNPGAEDATFQWTPASPIGTQQRLDLTFFDNNFEEGTYQSSELLGGTAASARWENLASGTIYRWRVVTFVDEERLASETLELDVPGCAIDPVG